MKKKYIIFELYEEICALRVDEIHEILELDSMVKTSSNELNLTIWNKMTLPVVDPVAMMDLSYHEPTIFSRIVVVEKRSLKFGVLVDQVLGIVELDERDLQEPSLTEPRYIAGKIEDFKLFSPEVFLTETMMSKFRKGYAIDLSGMDDAETVFGEKGVGKEQILEKVRLRSLNWLISASRRKIDEVFINEAMEIHNLVTKLQ